MPALSQDCLWWFPLLKFLQKRSYSISIRQVSKHLWLQRTKQYSQFQCKWKTLSEINFLREVSLDLHKQHYCWKQGLTPYWSHQLAAPQRTKGSKRTERIKNRAVSSTSECLIMKETGVSGAGSTHLGKWSNYRGVGKCSFCCIFKTVIKEISAKRSAASRNCQGSLATGSSVILSWVFHNRSNDSWNACLRIDKEKATLFCTRRLKPCSKPASKGMVAAQPPPAASALLNAPAASRQMGLPSAQLCDLLHAHKAGVTWVPPGWFIEAWVAHLSRGVGCRNACALTSFRCGILRPKARQVVFQPLRKFPNLRVKPKPFEMCC